MSISTIQRYSEVDIFSIKGRMGRSQYFVYSIVIPFIFFWIFASAAGIISKIGADANILAYALLGLSASLITFMVISLTIQRCHDFNASGWLAGLAFIPFANFIFAMIPGNAGLNRYGETPEPASSFIKTALIVIIGLLLALATFAVLYFFDINVRQYL